MVTDIELLWASGLEANTGYSIQEHSHICYQMYYVLQGEPAYLIAGKQFVAQPASFFFIPPYTPHKMFPICNENYRVYEFKFIVHNGYIQSMLPEEPVLLYDSAMIQRMLHYVVGNWRNSDENNVATIQHILYSVLSCFFIEHVRFDNRDSCHIDASGYSDISRAMIAYIENHYHKPFSMQRMAEELNYHRNYLSSVFSRDTGISVVDYLNLIRIRRAIVFFSFYNQDVFSTYESIGFTNPSHFSRVFKSLVGVSPRRFKLAFSTLDRKTVSQYFLEEPSLNFRVCSLEEAFASLKNMGGAAEEVLRKLE